MSTEERPLARRVGIVTGAGRGLGRASALDLAGAGAAVIVNNRNRQVDADGLGPADHVVVEIAATGGVAVAQYSDVGDPDAAQSILDLALNKFGRIDFLVTNAAISAPAMFHKSTAEQFDSVIRTNLAGTAHLAMLCSRQMRQAGFGRIVLVASTAGLHGEPTASAYSASKGAVIALGRAIAAEGAPRNVLTNLLLPYATTAMTESGMPQKYRDAMTAQRIAPVVTALVDPKSNLNGQVLVCGAGGLRVAAAVEYGSVRLPVTGSGPSPGHALSPAQLSDLIGQSRNAAPREFDAAQFAFADFALDVTGE